MSDRLSEDYLPPHVIPGTLVNLNSRIPAEAHWRFKMATTTRGVSMSEIMAELVTIYSEDPQRIDQVIAVCRARGATLGAAIIEALDVATSKAARPLLASKVASKSGGGS